MNLVKIVPLLNSDKLEALKAFYTTNFGFEVTFFSEEYLGLKSKHAPLFELGFMLPEPGTSVDATDQLRICLEVDDVDAEFERLKKRDVAKKPPQDNPWGDRSFEVIDPGGFKLYIYKQIPPSAEYAAYVKE